MQYDFNLQPNGGQTIEVVGRFVTYKEGLGKIRVKLSKGGFVDLVPGQGVEDVEFTQITINDLSGAINKGSVLAGTFKFRDATIAGAVQVIDGGKIRTFSGVAYQIVMSQVQTASMVACVQLWNPIGSNKNLIIESISMQCSTSAMQIGYGFTSAVYGNALQFAPSKKAGLAASATSRGYSQAAAASGAIAQIGGIGVLQSQSVEKRFTEPVVVPPGYGFGAWTGGTNIDVWATIEFFEEAL